MLDRLLILAAALGILAAASTAAAQCGLPGPNVIIGQVFDVGNFASTNGHDACALGAVVCNIGSVAVPYSGCPNQHPLIGGQMYRYSTVNGAGRMEQVGLSWLKHTAVAAAQTICCPSCTGGGGLGPGCADTYGSGFNGAQGTLGPRYQVNAFNGTYSYCPPHPSGGNYGRLEVALPDIVTTAGGSGAATRYFGEEVTISTVDATWTDAAHPVAMNGFDNYSNIEMTVSGASTNYTFALLGGATATQRMTPAINRWKQIDPAVTESTVFVTGEGEYYVSSRATSLGGSPAMWHYEYAVFNLNSDRCGGSFSVPVPDDLNVTNIGFHGVAYRGGDGNNGVNFDGSPWIATRANGTLKWATQSYDVNTNANAIRFATTYNFRFDTNAPPASPNGQVTLGLWKPGTPASITATAQVPACTAASIASSPASTAACPGGLVPFSVMPGGSLPAAYQWQVETTPGNWVALSTSPAPLPCGGGATAVASSPTAATTQIGVQPCAGVSVYRVRCIVTNACGSVASAAATLTIVTTADMNCDCVVSAADAGAFSLALLDETAYRDAYHDCDRMHADLNSDGQVDAEDVRGFVAALMP